MAALRRIRVGALAAGLVALAVGGVVACEPGGVSAAAVAYTTDETATAEIERRDVDVQWLTCTADYGDDGSSAEEQTVASVDCEGETGDGRDITVAGQVTRAVDGSCVRGDLRADVGKKQLFRVSGLGDCASATPSPVQPPGSGRPAEPGRPTVTVTVTVTETVRCASHDSDCGSADGK
ncbi:hypothetical protein [Streptomyces sp. A012304]|uniref:hypothetical protein n=1 Tax=Streptomyces sp. A012304 TaxID=375446 RepID=UPI0022316039|nr:hypothetical protein [Streptomyces sp. A012304]